MKYYFTSDTHYGHKNIIRYSNRPFNDVPEMDTKMIENWNSVVKPEDTVFHLGDFAFAEEDRIDWIVSQLNGQKFLIYGNHDKAIKKSKKIQSRFGWCKDYYELYVEDAEVSGGKQLIVLCHYAMVVWNKSHRGSWMLHGHSHGNLKYPFIGRIMDAGVDPQGYFPISYDQVKAKMHAIKNVSNLDHHEG